MGSWWPQLCAIVLVYKGFQSLRGRHWPTDEMGWQEIHLASYACPSGSFKLPSAVSVSVRSRTF